MCTTPTLPCLTLPPHPALCRSKKALGWRTLLVVPELEAELDVALRCKNTVAELRL